MREEVQPVADWSDEERARYADAKRVVGMLPGSRLHSFEPGRLGMPDSVVFFAESAEYCGRDYYRFAYYDRKNLVRFALACARFGVEELRERASKIRASYDKAVASARVAEQALVDLQKELES